MTRPNLIDPIDPGHRALEASGSAWNIEPGQSQASFTGATLWGRAQVTGDLGVASGELEWLGTTGRGQLRIATAQLHSGIRLRDHHLRSGAFFDVKRHPEVVFDVHEIALEGGEARLSGQLMVRGQQRALTCMANMHSLDEERIALQANGAFNLDELGMSRGLLRMVSARVTADIHVVLRRAPQ